MPVENIEVEFQARGIILSDIYGAPKGHEGPSLSLPRMLQEIHRISEGIGSAIDDKCVRERVVPYRHDAYHYVGTIGA